MKLELVRAGVSSNGQKNVNSPRFAPWVFYPGIDIARRAETLNTTSQGGFRDHLVASIFQLPARPDLTKSIGRPFEPPGHSALLKPR